MNGTVAKLRDGRSVLIRPIRKDGVARLAEGIRKLSPRSRQMRFFTTREIYSTEELIHVVRADGFNALTLVAALLDDFGNEIESIGAAHFFRDSPGSESAEVAIAVLDEYHRLGVGTALLNALAAKARAVGVLRWTAIASPENEAIMKLLSRIGSVREDRVTAATRELTIEL